MQAHVLNVLTFLGIFFCANALNCRSDGGPKEEELKKLYMNCLKSQDGRNSSNNRDREYSDDHSSREKRKQNQWGRREEGSLGSRDDWSGSDWSRSRDNRDSNSRTQSRDDWSGSQDDRTSSRNDRMGNSRDRMNINSRDRMNGREDFTDDDNDESEQQSYRGYKSSTQQSRRMKRERSSGHRSQYNPNPSKSSGYENSNRNNERNSSENSTSIDADYKKACALHCFLDELEMTGETGMPDRYLVTQVITKDVKNEDLRDFLHESIEECFQILYNENTQDKCEFSKNLMLCLSEKGRANCDDWKDDPIRF